MSVACTGVLITSAVMQATSKAVTAMAANLHTAYRRLLSRTARVTGMPDAASTSGVLRTPRQLHQATLISCLAGPALLADLSCQALRTQHSGTTTDTGY